MNDIVFELMADHHHMMKILSIMRQATEWIIQLPPLDLTVGSEYQLLQSCTQYMCRFPDSIHHPKEEIIFDKLAKQNCAASYVDILRSEHIGLGSKSKMLDQLLTEFKQTTVPVQPIVDKSSEYIDSQIQHMRTEEMAVFPLMTDRLTINDWKEIIKSFPGNKDYQAEQDNEFKKITSQYQQLVEQYSIKSA